MTSNAMGPNSPLLPRSADDPLDRPHTTGSTDYEPSSITVSHSTAKWLVPASMVFNVGMQIYGMRSSPNMKEIADANPAAFSPHPFAILGVFIPEVIVQALWVYFDFYNSKPSQESLDYVPIFALGEVAIGVWAFFWQRERFIASQVCVTINSLAQLWAVTRLPAMQEGNKLTHWVAKIFAGIGVLDILDNGAMAVALKKSPNLAVKVLTLLGFPAMQLASDWLLGAVLLYDVLGLYLGHSGNWQTWLGGTGVLSGAVYIAKQFFLTVR